MDKLIFFLAILFFSVGLFLNNDGAKIKNKEAVKNTVKNEIDVKHPLVSQPIESAVVAYAIDGDTVELNNGKRLRYLGVDAPEIKRSGKPEQCYGKEAFKKNKELVQGKQVRLEKDISETDKYGRLLRYVWLDGILVNEELVRQGYARAVSYPPDVRYRERFREAEQTARAGKAGFWGVPCGK